MHGWKLCLWRKEELPWEPQEFSALQIREMWRDFFGSDAREKERQCHTHLKTVFECKQKVIVAEMIQPSVIT